MVGVGLGGIVGGMVGMGWWVGWLGPGSMLHAWLTLLVAGCAAPGSML